MQGIAKAVPVAILTSILIVLFINLSFFFPWYLTLITETYNVTQIVASDNYLKEDEKDDVLDRLQDRPIYRDKAGYIEIDAYNPDDMRSAIGSYEPEYYADLTELEKPYRQRGEPITVEISAVYPFSITLWGRKLERELPVSFSMTTTGLRHYKDLDFNPYR